MKLAARPPARVLAVVLIAFGLLVLSAHSARAANPAPQVACPSCEDYDPCTMESCDETLGTCRHDPINCDDGNACTADTCNRLGPSGFVGCHHTFLPSGTACNDGDACTSADACNSSGTCAGQLQAPGSACDDGNPCTAGDACGAGGTCAGAPLAVGAECDDVNACTLGERCVEGPSGITCQASERNCDDANPCTNDSCDPITGDCVNPPLNCDDGNPCTVDACDRATGACTRSTRTGSCEDRNICTVNDACLDGNCVGGGPGNCGWGPQCGSSVCLPSEQRCLQSPSTTGCPAPPQPECGNRYDCRNGFCAFVQGAGPLPCSDGNPCTLEQCVRGACTVQLSLTGGTCDDGTACTSGDICQSGTCRGAPACGDGDACTDDLCDAATGACLGHPPRNCDDDNPCSTDSCDPAVGCGHAANTDACNDNNACTSNDRCDGFSCHGTLSVSCPDDGNACTFDECDSATGACVHPNSFGLCDDSNPCTVSDFCQDGSCHSGSPKFCDDFNACTADVCQPATGVCLHPAAEGPCNDGSACTAGDACVAGSCVPGPPPNCDDGNPCTTDGCVSFAGCFHTVITGSCEDGNPCTTGDACVNGVCQPTAPVSCIEGNSCTIDHCDRTTGVCIHDAIGGDCDDGDACTVDQCDPANGACIGAVPADCDDGSPCTSDACDPAVGCTHVVTCPQRVEDLQITFAVQGSGTLTWRTTAEVGLGGFNILLTDQQDDSVPINPALIPCTQCATGAGASYSYTIPKHKSGNGYFVEVVGSDGSVLGIFGPAVKVPKGQAPSALQTAGD